MTSKTAALVEVSAFFLVSYLFSALKVWPTAQINGAFIRLLGAKWNYGFLFYKILLVTAVFFLHRRTLVAGIVSRGSNRPALIYGLLFAGLGAISVCFGLVTGKETLKGMGALSVIDTLLFQLVNDTTEELTYRGYILERLGKAFPKSWDFGGFTAGPGLLISSFLFGLVHLLNPFNPFAGSMAISIEAGLKTFGVGWILGLLREAFGSMIPPILFHAIPDILGNFTTNATGAIFVVVVAIEYAAVFFLILFIAKRRKRASATSSR